MIIPIIGNVTYSITLDPTVWIFDDRKILLDEAFTSLDKQDETEDELKKASEVWDRAIEKAPPVNRSISRMEGNKILENSYVMPINYFLDNAEINPKAETATLVTNDEDVEMPLHDLYRSCFLFSVEGKPLKEDGPVHLYYMDGSNKEDPIKNVTKIIIN
ncbi:hypothetical protein KFZ58_08190 [Virgibacillus sp. NKC19-16]|uniref:hypothetical protein n=1 Tax=Virgibacillus salidurans TaxID=2831673 RepID=UPI001F405404|nr:hypothetical protein [Virgibacillus sp. NKC19-16]UJL47817.1 hypothetical protein KFZ58_08190 [Virgibacillus sp. NKC19-16]